MAKFSAFSLAWNALSHHRNWTRYWQNPPLAKKYDVLIIGAGGIAHNVVWDDDTNNENTVTGFSGVVVCT